MVELTQDEIRLIDIDIALSESERIVEALNAERREIINRLGINKRERGGKQAITAQEQLAKAFLNARHKTDFR